ncbi:hypothetical protein LC55x_5064 [Lysobacter capsici]|nr:hypothetical protein LC55x_5064 [Lysobacter capsici]
MDAREPAPSVDLVAKPHFNRALPIQPRPLSKPPNVFLNMNIPPGIALGKAGAAA